MSTYTATALFPDTLSVGGGPSVVMQASPQLPAYNLQVGPVISQTTVNNYGNSQGYQHNQPAAAAVWTVVHGLAKYPSVTVVDSAGDEVEGQVRYLSSNEIEIAFSAAFAGKAYLN